MYTAIMKYDWNPKKNEWLKKERKLSFEEVVFHLSQGDVWKVADHPDQQKYPGEKMNFDKEEKDILHAYESGSMKLSTPSKKEIERIKTIAKNTFKKDKRITLRLYDHDYKGIQKKAMEMGIPYQTLISGIIHRYIEGELVSKNG